MNHTHFLIAFMVMVGLCGFILGEVFRVIYKAAADDKNEPHIFIMFCFQLAAMLLMFVTLGGPQLLGELP